MKLQWLKEQWSSDLKHNMRLMDHVTDGRTLLAQLKHDKQRVDVQLLELHGFRVELRQSLESLKVSGEGGGCLTHSITHCLPSFLS